MLTVRAVFIASLLVSSVVLGQDQGDAKPPAATPPADDNACIDKPCGYIECQARCVASCLDTGLASNVTECVNQFCLDFNEETPCPVNDTACWKTCGFVNTPDDPPSPPIPDDLRLGKWADGFSSANANPKTVQIEWPATKDASLYLVQAYPMFGKDPDTNNQHILQNMTTETSFTFQRADLCNVYMVRVMAVNGFGTSSPRYLIVDAWKPELHFDENFDIQYIRQEGDYVKVQINYTPPPAWNRGDVDFENSLVRAYGCLGPLDADFFLSTQPDEDGYYTPMVFINETESSVDLSFPAKVMQSKCLFSYRVLALRSLCNATLQFDPKDAAGVDFSLNCLSVENSECSTTSAENTPETQNNSSSPDQGGDVAIIVLDPEAMKELKEETTTAPDTTPSDNTGVLIKADSDEVVIVANPEAMKELEQESTQSPTTQATDDSSTEAASAESGEVTAAPESAEQEITDAPAAQDSEEATTTSVPESVEEETTEAPPAQDSEEVIIGVAPDTPADEEIAASAEAPSDSDSSADSKDSEQQPLSPPSPLSQSGEIDAPPPPVMIEPINTNVPFCKMAEFEAEVEVVKDGTSSEEQVLAANVFWLEDKPQSFDAFSVPTHFIVRYGPVTRTLIVDPQPDIVDETIMRTPEASDELEEVPRTLRVTDLVSNGLYAFQICAIYESTMDLVIPWDTAPRYVVDLSAANSVWRNGKIVVDTPTTPTPLVDAASDYDFVDQFINALNSSFNTAQETADSLNAAQPTKDASTSMESSGDEEVGTLIIIPQQPPPVLHIDVKPVVITEGDGWSTMRPLWLIMALMMLALTVTAFMVCVLRSARNRRGLKQRQFREAPTGSIYYMQTPPPTVTSSDVKIPIA